MAESPVPELEFRPLRGDCGQRRARLPAPLPAVGDDFDWSARDYDGIRMAMLEDLAARFPERTRWTPADLEVVLVEALAAMLDGLSDLADRVAAEACLETARCPSSLRRLLRFIGYDAARLAGFTDDPSGTEDGRTASQKLEQAWMDNPAMMETARRAGPRAVHTQYRMVTVDDYRRRMEEHPLVLRAAADSDWTGSWRTLRVSILLPWPETRLDDPLSGRIDPGSTGGGKIVGEIESFHRQRGIPLPDWTGIVSLTYRRLLGSYVGAHRMSGQETLLGDCRPVGIAIALTVAVAPSYFRSEVRRAVEGVLSNESGGMFERGRLSFGEDLHLSNLYQAVTAIDGVQHVEVTEFRRCGVLSPLLPKDGTLALAGTEIAVCDNVDETRGWYALTLEGGRRG